MFIVLVEDGKGLRRIMGHSKQKKEMIMYMEDRIQQKKLEVKNNWESTLSYISIFNKFIADIFIGLVYDYNCITH